MFILYFYHSYHEYYHAKFYQVWIENTDWRPGEGAWLVPGTDPDDCFYVL